MAREDASEFMHQRLHRRPPRRAQPALARPRRVRVTRRVALRMERGRTEVIENVDDSVLVECAQGCVWITQDGDPKDVILGARQSWRADREEPMQIHALQTCILEIEFEDEIDPVLPV
jgi:hypothetical protein